MFSMVCRGASDAKQKELLMSVMADLAGPPSLILCGASIATDLDVFQNGDHSDVPFHGASSCLGVMTNEGPFVEGSAGAGILCISDPMGAYGSAVVSMEGETVEEAARHALQKALAQAGRPGETPELIWLSSTPGMEERVIASIHETIGKGVPICGGSAADNTVSGDWVVFDRSARFGSGGRHHRHVPVCFGRLCLSFRLPVNGDKGSGDQHRRAKHHGNRRPTRCTGLQSMDRRQDR